MSEHPKKTPAPPKTRSGEMQAVKTFQDAITTFDDETVPKMDVEVDRMGELLKQVSSSPASKTDRKDTPIPKPPRSPSFVDDEERDADESKEPDSDE